MIIVPYATPQIQSIPAWSNAFCMAAIAPGADSRKSRACSDSMDRRNAMGCNPDRCERHCNRWRTLLVAMGDTSAPPCVQRSSWFAIATITPCASCEQWKPIWSGTLPLLKRSLASWHAGRSGERLSACWNRQNRGRRKKV